MNDVLLQQTQSQCLCFIGEAILVCENTLSPYLPTTITLDGLGLTVLSRHLDRELDIIDGTLDLSSDALAAQGYQLQPVKWFLARVDAQTQAQIVRAYHWRNWHVQSQFCGRCGGPLDAKLASPDKKCLVCQQSVFPRFSPAVMVLIQKGDHILLARPPHFRPNYYSAIAGFIEIGETAEQAAHREVLEEVGLEIGDLEYFSTQTWPFPDSFMIAFKAQYRSGEIRLLDKELEEARWFTAADLPELPPRSSIARKLIDHVLAQA